MDHRALLLLRAARETGVIEACVTNAETVEEVAEGAGVTERAARITVDALVDLGFLERVSDGGFEPTNKMLGFITKTDVRSIGRLPHELDCLDRWLDLPETMRTGSPPEKPANWTRNALGAMAAVDESTVRAFVTAAIHEQPDAETVVDVGGGAGMFAQEFARRGYDVTLVDTEDVIEADEPLLEHEPISLTAADVTKELPGSYDLVFCSRLAHSLSPAENRQLLENALDALEPGGTLVHIDQLRNRADGASMLAAHMLAQTEGGETYTEAQFGEWLGEAGFEHSRVENVPGTDYQLVAGDKRDSSEGA